MKHQTVQPLEIIIVDGESTDRSLEIIENYKSFMKIRVIKCSKRNFGFLRNLGHRFTKGHIILQCNTDNYFPMNFIEQLIKAYCSSFAVCISGRVYPAGTSWIAKLAYPSFDLVRFFSTKLGKYRPSGSFCSYQRDVWAHVGGFPEVTVNEDGLFGQRIDEFDLSTRFELNLYVGHWVKKFESMGGLKALMFYMYVLRNHFPMLEKFLASTEAKAGKVFSHQ